MSTVFWVLSKIAFLIALLWGLLMMFATFGIDLVLHGSIETEDLGTGLFFGGVVAFAIGFLVNPFPWRARRAARDPNAELAMATPLTMLVGMIVALLLVASACAYVLASGPGSSAERGMAIGGLILCLLGLIGAPRIRRRHSLRLSSHGLDYSGFGCGPIAWRDIALAEVDYRWRSWVVTLEVSDEEKYFQRGLAGFGRRSRWVRHLLWSPFSIPVLVFNVSPEWLRRAVQIRVDHFSNSGTASSPIAQRQGMTA